MDTSFEWKPEPVLLEKVIALANQRGQSPEAIVDQAVAVYVQTQSHSRPELSRGQELINLMRGKATAKLTTDEIMYLTRGDDD
ncbi:MAG: hypothetical protein ACR2FS_08515 [Phormidesmis sp.]